MEKKIKKLREHLYEDDLLEQQSHFLEESKDPKFEPTVTQLYKSEQVIKDGEKKEEPSITNVFMPLNIVEHDTSNVSANEIERIIGESAKSDDKLLKCDLSNFKARSPNKKKSIFSQYMESKRQRLSNSSVQQVVLTSASKVSIDTTDVSLIDGSGLYEDSIKARKEIESISKENDEKLNALNDEDKRALLREYFDVANKEIDPNLINLIKMRKAKKISKSNEVNKDYVRFDLSSSTKADKDKIAAKEVQNMIIEENTTNSDQTLIAPYIDEEEIKKNNWLNMNKVEVEKLEWMMPLIEKEPKKQANSSVEGKAARFNFEGDLIVKEETDYRKGLHHHSEQDTASGYTINELIALTQSKYIPQRILALNTLANIFRRMHRGYFDICFDKSLTIELIEQTELLILLRRLLDDSNTSIQLVTIKCIHSLVCNTIYDEFCLDRLFCSLELGIEIPELCYVELESEKELKDEQLCKLDVVRCLIRMNILQRLRYLLDNLLLKQPQNTDPMVIDNIMDILIRIYRHSSKSCDEVVGTPYLIESIIHNFIASPTNILNWKALKIIRIIFTSNKENIVKIKKQFPKLWITLANYLIMNPPNDEDKELYPSIIEVLRVYRVLLIMNNESNETTDQFKCELATNIKCCMNIKILTNNSFDLHYASNLLHCLAYVIQKLTLEQKLYFEGFFTPLIQDLTFRWFKEIVDYNELPKFDGCLAISSALLYLNWSCTSKEQIFQNILKPILYSSDLLHKLTDRLLKNSSIIHFKEYHNSVYRDSKALPSFGSIYFGGTTIRINQLLNEESIIFFAGSLVGLAAKHKLIDCLTRFLYDSAVKLYLDKIVNKVQKTSNWTIFELIEFNPISQFILWEQSVLDKNEYFDHALALLSSVGDVQLKRSLYEYVFDVKQYKLMFDLNAPKDNSLDLIKSSICFFNEIKKLYSNYSAFEDQNWIFEPLIKLYRLESNSDCQSSEDELSAQLISCLNYLILIYNFKSNYLWSIVEKKVLFVYLSSVFLFKNGLFLNDELLKILKYFFIELFTKNQINFECYEETLPEPFNSIADHFTTLCNSYKTDSYGNYVFSNYLLAFLNQSSDRIFRKKFLDEHSACLNYFILKEEELLFNLEYLIRLPETDLTIVESYCRILLAKDIIKQRNPLIYKIACTQVSKSLFSEDCHEIRLQNPELAQKLINSIKISNNSQLQLDLYKN